MKAVYVEFAYVSGYPKVTFRLRTRFERRWLLERSSNTTVL